MVAGTTNPAELLKIVKAAKMASSSDSMAFIVFAGHANIEDFFKVLRQECQSVQRRFLFYKDKSPCVNSSSSTNCVEQFLVGFYSADRVIPMRMQNWDAGKPHQFEDDELDVHLGCYMYPTVKKKFRVANKVSVFNLNESSLIFVWLSSGPV